MRVLDTIKPFAVVTSFSVSTSFEFFGAVYLSATFCDTILYQRCTSLDLFSRQGLRLRRDSNIKKEVNVPETVIALCTIVATKFNFKEAGYFTDFLICYIPALRATLALQKLAAPQGHPSNPPGRNVKTSRREI